MASSGQRLCYGLGEFNIGSFTITSDLDIYRSAKLLIDQHGEDADVEVRRHHAVSRAIGSMQASSSFLTLLIRA